MWEYHIYKYNMKIYNVFNINSDCCSFPIKCISYMIICYLRVITNLIRYLSPLNINNPPYIISSIPIKYSSILCWYIVIGSIKSINLLDFKLVTLKLNKCKQNWWCMILYSIIITSDPSYIISSWNIILNLVYNPNLFCNIQVISKYILFN